MSLIGGANEAYPFYVDETFALSPHACCLCFLSIMSLIGGANEAYPFYVDETFALSPHVLPLLFKYYVTEWRS